MPSRPATASTAFAFITAIIAAAFAPTSKPHRPLRWRLLGAVQQCPGVVRRVRQRRRVLPQGLSGLAGRVCVWCSRLRARALLRRHGARPEAATTAIATTAAIAAASSIATTSTIASTSTPLRGLVLLPPPGRD